MPVVRRHARITRCLPTKPVEFGKPIAKKVLHEEEGEHGQSEKVSTPKTGADTDESD